MVSFYPSLTSFSSIHSLHPLPPTTTYNHCLHPFLTSFPTSTAYIHSQHPLPTATTSTHCLHPLLTARCIPPTTRIHHLHPIPPQPLNLKLTLTSLPPHRTRSTAHRTTAPRATPPRATAAAAEDHRPPGPRQENPHWRPGLPGQIQPPRRRLSSMILPWDSGV